MDSDIEEKIVYNILALARNFIQLFLLHSFLYIVAKMLEYSSVVIEDEYIAVFPIPYLDVSLML